MAVPRSRANGRRGILWLVILVGAAVLAVVGWTVVTGGLPGQTATPAAPAASAPPRPADAFPLIVERVVDGDTLRATVDGPNDAFDIHDTLRIRLIGIDTPETADPAECWSAEATAHLRALAPEGSVLWGAADRDPFDRYDRALLYLWTPDDRFVNLELVAAGDAQTLTVEPNDAHADLFAAAEASARQQGLGLWGAC